VGATRSEADIVLPLTPQQQARVFESPEACESHYAAEPRAYGVIRAGRFGKTFPRTRWEALAQSGDFLLISNGPALAARAGKAGAQQRLTTSQEE
jgi:hypothetical protein